MQTRSAAADPSLSAAGAPRRPARSTGVARTGRGATGVPAFAGEPASAPPWVTRGELGRALRENAFGLYLQPIADPGRGHVAGYEMLLRWRHAGRGLLLPEDFIPFAEATGFIVDIDRWVVEHAADYLWSWRRRGYDGWLAVNVSARSLEDAGFVADVTRIVEASPELPGHFLMELTETAQARNAEAVGAALASLRRAGVRIAIDDFGSGYTSLASLSDLGFDAIKIDRTLLTQLGSDRRVDAIVRSVIFLARELDVTVVAEGVECDAQRAWLAEYRNVLAQGYLLGRPAPAGAVALHLGELR